MKERIIIEIEDDEWNDELVEKYDNMVACIQIMLEESLGMRHGTDYVFNNSF